LKGQIFSLDAVVSLGILAAVVAVWLYMYQDFSPVIQAYTYRATYLAAEHAINRLLYDPDVAWRCETPTAVLIPSCVRQGVTITRGDLDLDDFNMNYNISCNPPLPMFDETAPVPAAPETPVLVRSFTVCVGDWNDCTIHDCNMEVWHV